MGKKIPWLERYGFLSHQCSKNALHDEYLLSCIALFWQLFLKCKEYVKYSCANAGDLMLTPISSWSSNYLCDL